MLYSRRDHQQHKGAAIIFKKDLEECLLEWKPIKSRLIKVRFKGRHITQVSSSVTHQQTTVSKTARTPSRRAWIRTGEHTASCNEDFDGRSRGKCWKWQQELRKGHGERSMWHHEGQWREATGHLDRLWFCHWRDALSTLRRPQAVLVLVQWKRQQPDWPPDNHQDMEAITARRPSEKRSCCRKWQQHHSEAEAEEYHIQSERRATLWRGEAGRL